MSDPQGLAPTASPASSAALETPVQEVPAAEAVPAVVTRLLICPFCASEFADTHPRRCPTCGHSCECGPEIHAKLIWARVFTWLGIVLFPLALWTPLLTLQNLGGTTEVSFVTGVKKLLENQDYVLAILIALFSGVLPLLKSMAMLILTSSSFLSVKHSRLVYAFVELTSRFSMADVFLSGASIMLFKGSPLFRFAAQPGIIIFTCMVVCNLLAAMLYDTRVLGTRVQSPKES